MIMGKMKIAVGCVLALGSFAIHGQEAQNTAADAAGQVAFDKALEAEIEYASSLIDGGFPDLAEIVIKQTKEKWPESEATFFAIEVRGLLSLNKFDEAEKKIAALPNRDGEKYWAARIEVANNLFYRGKKDECKKIYKEFFTKYPKPPKALFKFHRDASYMYGQLLMSDKDYKDAVKIYTQLLGQINPRGSSDEANSWCNVACETVTMYLQLAEKEKDKNVAKGYLDAANKIVGQLLWRQDMPVYFGRSIAMKAHLELLRGDLARAQGTIDDYMEQLAGLHKQIKEFDPDGKKGWLKQSPMPQCRYLLAEMLWKEVQSEKAKPKRDDDRIKNLLFGEKNKKGKRNGAGAYNHALNVFVQYPESQWASKAGDLAEEIRAFAEKEYGAKIKTNITAKQMEKVRAMQFRAAYELYAEQNWDGAIKEYLQVLGTYPETMESIGAIENLISTYLNKIIRIKNNPKQVEELRIDADAIEGYLSERFAGNKSRELMTAAGDAVMRVANKERGYGDFGRADALTKAFLLNYTRHVNAAPIALALMSEDYKAKKYDDAIAIANIIEENYTNTLQYATALSLHAYCLKAQDDNKGYIEKLAQYVTVEKNDLPRLQAQMNLAQAYKLEGTHLLKAAQAAENEEEKAAQMKQGTAQTIRAIKQFTDFAAKCNAKLAEPNVPDAEKEKYKSLCEDAIFLVGDCWARMNMPADKIPFYRKKAVEGLEKYVKIYPRGRHAIRTYVSLGTIYTAANDMTGSKNALDRLMAEFPESPEAKNAMPRIAKTLVEMGMNKEAAQVYGDMLDKDGAYTANQFVAAGKSLIEAREWDLANRAFEKAIAKAGTNQVRVVAKARIGMAESLYAQKNYIEARDAIDQFLADKKMSKLSDAAEATELLMQVASAQGRTEKDEMLRKKHFGAAIGAVKKLRNYWRKKPQWEVDALDLKSAEISADKMNAEIAMGLEKESMETCALTAARLKSFLQAHSVTPEHPFDKMSPGEAANLERCYSMMIPLLSKLGKEQAGDVLRFGEEFLKFFPNSKNMTEVQNCINQAKATGAVASVASENEAKTLPKVEDEGVADTEEVEAADEGNNEEE